MKNTSKKQIIILFFISILGLGTMLGILYFNHKTNIEQNKAHRFLTESYLMPQAQTIDG